MRQSVQGGGDGKTRVPPSTLLAEEEAGGGWRLRNWRVRSRLVAMILVPTTAAVLLGGVQVVSSVNAASDYQRVNELARLSERISALTHELAGERSRIAWFIAQDRPGRVLPSVRDQIDRVDRAVGQVRSVASAIREGARGRAQDEVETALNRLEDLAALRNQAIQSTLLPDAAISAYTQVIADLLSLHDEIGKGSADDVLFARSMTLTALAKAKESAALRQALLTAVLVNGRFEQQQLEDFLGAMSREENELKNFAAEATSDERRFFDETVRGRPSDRAESLQELVLIRSSIDVPLRGLDLSKSDDAREWFEAMAVVVDRMRVVEQRHTKSIVTRSQDLSDQERGQAVMAAGAVGALLLAVLLITSGVARSLVRPLRRLRSEALEIAGDRLPDFVQRVRETRDAEAEIEVPPIGIFSRDEVGQVARAFDEVHREAVRLAGDEARLRGNINAMFVNLSRRSQTLVERQLTLIERLEQGERDDRRLADLFKLDHLATRMRRNSENLLVLAGQEAARKWSQPVELNDVVRASLSEVESYDRVVTHGQAEVAIGGQAVSDIVHLLAELVENAVSFSPRDTMVVVTSNHIEGGGGVMLSVTDQGIGMTPDEQAQANWRLANPPVVDVSVSRRMGLFVVGRLALRHGVRVQLRPHEAGGLTAMVVIPEKLVAPIPGAAKYAQPAQPAFPSMNPPAGGSAYPGPGHPSGGYDLPPFGDSGTPVIPQQGRSETFSSGSLGSSGPPLPRRKAPPLSAPPSAPSLPTPSSSSPAPVPHSTPLTPPPRVPAPGDSGEQTWFTSTNPLSLPPSAQDAGVVSMAHEPGPFPVMDVDSSTYPPGSLYGRGADPTGPLPRVETSAFDNSGDDYLPIFAAVESDWFKKGGARSTAGDQSADTSEPVWQSLSDEGWKAAEAASEPSLGGLTASGLPKRKPRANLVPGSAKSRSTPSTPVPMPKLSPDHVRSRLSSFQQGIMRARAEASEPGRAEAVEEDP
ncbi:hypothetical protein Ssi02_16250 [Sinosporangium siamense]|uniref:histidine kinase n=2 Tax=Sinosporangium siamense TaxID=1367973 RepID=A0A919RFD4_9ACTN|nr:hypothetical protein Ssi02_16250 [Sinosporangium siamense]